MKYQYANIKSLKADIAKHEITVSFVVDMQQENMAVSEQLTPYVGVDAGTVAIDISPRQLSLTD